jgi:hypothetical protein
MTIRSGVLLSLRRAQDLLHAVSLGLLCVLVAGIDPSLFCHWHLLYSVNVHSCHSLWTILTPIIITSSRAITAMTRIISGHACCHLAHSRQCRPRARKRSTRVTGADRDGQRILGMILLTKHENIRQKPYQIIIKIKQHETAFPTSYAPVVASPKARARTRLTSKFF